MEQNQAGFKPTQGGLHSATCAQLSSQISAGTAAETIRQLYALGLCQQNQINSSYGKGATHGLPWRPAGS